jgi:Xaa-Pro aminopeptidase
VSPSTGAALAAMDHAARRSRLRDLFGDAGCEALLVTNPIDVRYLTGFSGSNGAVIVGCDAADDLLVTDARYRERVGGLDVPRIEIERRVEGVLAGLGAVPLGVDADHTSLAQASRYEAARDGAALVGTSGLVAGLRASKDAAEVERLRRACAITAATLAQLAAEGLRPGIEERALAREVEQAFHDRGADGVAFPTIVAAGVSGASPHHGAGDGRLETGDLVTIDCGAEVDGYRADMTRTFAVGAERDVSARMLEVHAVVVAANAAGRAAAVVGGAVADVDRAARRVVQDAGYGDAFVHPTGHGIGLDVHEAPLVHGASAASLGAGTTFTVEPGIYLPGVGGVRIEDSLVVLEDTVDVMTDLERGMRPA